MADRVARHESRRKLEQVASPTEIYDRPATLSSTSSSDRAISCAEVLGSDAAGCLVGLADGAAIHAAI